MPAQHPSRRSVLGGGLAIAGAASLSFVHTARAALPEPTRITPELIAAAAKEGKLSWYTSVDLALAEKTARTFEARHPGVAVRVERSGAERNFQRIGQEYASNIFNCDVVEASDAAHFIIWKRDGLLTPNVPEDVAAHFPPEHRDADGMYASWRILLSIIAYNTQLVKADDAPRSFADLLDPKWMGKLVKAHPGYSGGIMTATQQMSRDLGWEYFEKLAKQKVMQLQSAADPPKKLALGERAVMVDGGDYLINTMKAKGQPVEPVYASEGTPLITGPAAVMKKAPNPNAARLFHTWLFSLETQQLITDVGGLRSAHGKVREPDGRKPLAQIKTMREDAAAVAEQADFIKTRYAQIFKV